MLERLREFVAEHGLIPEGVRVLVGFSGGSDSTCLLHLLRQAGYDVVAGHLNHLQRPEADADQAHCAAVAESLGVPFVAGRADVPQLAADLKIGLEEAGRQARYAFFEEAAAQTGCGRIATAHTLSDHVETVLLNVARGTGLAGLAGIPIVRGEIIRPLRFAQRQETVAYCESCGLETLMDPGNDDLRFARVRMRKVIVPELYQINQAVEANVDRLASLADEEDRFLDGAAAAALEQAEEPLNGPHRFLTLDREAAFRLDYLRHLPSVLRRRALRLVAEALGGRLDSTQTLALDSGFLAEAHGSITAEGGQVVFSWNDRRLHAQRMEGEEAPSGPVMAPGTTVHAEFGWALTLRLEEGQAETPVRDAFRVPIDIDAFRGPLHYRTYREGETLTPIGGTGGRKLSDLLSESGLTLLARRRLPILCDIIGPLWAPGVSLAERARPAGPSERFLRAEFGPLEAKRPMAETERRLQTYANS